MGCYHTIMDNEAKRLLKAGHIFVMPTDTIYGLVARAENEEAVETIYQLKQRDEKKPMIVLIGAIWQLGLFGVQPARHIETFRKYWPGPTSIVLPVDATKHKHLQRSGSTIAFRLPDDRQLQMLMKEVGPLVATSANISDQPTATNIDEARRYFGEAVHYIDGGEIAGKASKVIIVEDGQERQLRP